jgi:hypothetical protein
MKRSDTDNELGIRQNVAVIATIPTVIAQEVCPCAQRPTPGIIDNLKFVKSGPSPVLQTG